MNKTNKICPECKRKFKPAVNRDCKTCLRREADLRFADKKGKNNKFYEQIY